MKPGITKTLLFHHKESEDYGGRSKTEEAHEKKGLKPDAMLLFTYS